MSVIKKIPKKDKIKAKTAESGTVFDDGFN